MNRGLSTRVTVAGTRADKWGPDHMSQVQFDVTYSEVRNRLTTAFRMILAIPHAIFVQV